MGLFLLTLYGVSELLSGIFPIDVGAEATTAGTIHNIVGNISFFCFPIAMILLSPYWVRTSSGNLGVPRLRCQLWLY